VNEQGIWHIKGLSYHSLPLIAKGWKMCRIGGCLSVHFLEFSSLDLCFCYLLCIYKQQQQQHVPCLLLLKELISFTGPRQWHKSINLVFLSVIMSLGTELHLYLTLEWNVTEMLLHKTMHNLPKNFVLSCNTNPICWPVLCSSVV
jgi:hypothetical protein